jgi:hypothetical protein
VLNAKGVEKWSVIHAQEQVDNEKLIDVVNSVKDPQIIKTALGQFFRKSATSNFNTEIKKRVLYSYINAMVFDSYDRPQKPDIVSRSTFEGRKRVPQGDNTKPGVLEGYDVHIEDFATDINDVIQLIDQKKFA